MLLPSTSTPTTTNRKPVTLFWAASGPRVPASCPELSAADCEPPRPVSCRPASCPELTGIIIICGLRNAELPVNASAVPRRAHDVGLYICTVLAWIGDSTCTQQFNSRAHIGLYTTMTPCIPRRSLPNNNTHIPGTKSSAAAFRTTYESNNMSHLPIPWQGTPRLQVFP